MPNKLVFVGFGFRHHLGGHAGYHQLKKYLDYDYIVDAQDFYNKALVPQSKSIFSKINIGIRRRIIAPFCFGFYYVPWFLLKCIFLAIIKGHLTFHFIYGENLYRDVSLLHCHGCKVVCTFHQPFEWFKARPQWQERLKTLDHIILVGESEVQLFEQVTGRKNVSFIPHGICSDFYCEDLSVKKEHMVLTVGNWLRDYEFADKVYQKLLKADPDVRIIIVSLPKNKMFITLDDRVTFLSGISDEELRCLYRKTSCLFLPLTRYTANNALLEAGAVGCPILISCNQSDNSYIPEDYVNFCPLEIENTFAKIQNMLNTHSVSLNLPRFVQSHFGWMTIAVQTEELLRNKIS